MAACPEKPHRAVAVLPRAPSRALRPLTIRALALLALAPASWAAAPRTTTVVPVEGGQGERTGPQYNVQLLTRPLPLAARAEAADGTRAVRMRKKDGRLYLCHLPLPLTPDEPMLADPADADAVAAAAAETAIAHSAAAVATYLQPLAGTCFYRLEGWWTYEVCMLRSVRQFHQEKHAVMQDFTLGAYWTPDGMAEVGAGGVTDMTAGGIASGTPVGTILKIPAGEKAKAGAAEAGGQSWEGEAKAFFSGELVSDAGLDSKATYYKQVYGNGTECELTGKPRETELRIFCAHEPTHIASVKEVATCSYVVSLNTEAVCAHPAFQAASKGSSRPPVPIRCEPIPEAATGEIIEPVIIINAGFVKKMTENRQQLINGDSIVVRGSVVVDESVVLQGERENQERARRARSALEAMAAAAAAARTEMEAARRAQMDAHAQVEAEAEAQAAAEAKAAAGKRADRAAAEAAAEAADEAAAQAAQAKAATEVLAQAIADARAEAEAQAQLAVEEDARAQAETEAQAQAQQAAAQSQAQAEAEVEARAQAQAEAWAEARAQAQAWAETAGEAATEGEARAETVAEARAEAEGEASGEWSEGEPDSSPDYSESPPDSTSDSSESPPVEQAVEAEVDGSADQDWAEQSEPLVEVAE